MKKIILWSVLCCLSCSNLLAQACFNANVVRGCAPLTITLADCSGGTNIAYKYSEAEGFVNRVTNTYTVPGKYFITQIVQIGTAGDSLRKNDYIEVLPSPTPLFEVRLCAGRKVSLNITDTQYEQCLVNWGDGSSAQIVPRGTTPIEHIYATTGTFSLKVKGNYIPGDCGAEGAVLINPLNSLPTPTIEAVSTQVRNATTGAITVRILTRPDFDYVLFADGNPTPLASFAGIDGIVVKTIENINTQGALCLKVKTADKCGASTESSAIYCHIGLTVAAEDNQNRLTWDAYTGAVPTGSFLRYILYKNSQPFHLITDIAQNSYVDDNVTCKENYDYYVQAEFASPTFNFRVISNTASALAFSTKIPPKVSRLNSTVETARSIRLFWEVENFPKIKQYEIKRNGETVFSDLHSQDLIDADLRLDKQFCYEIRYTNICDNSSEWAVRVCPIFLSVLPAEAGKVRLQWTAYQNPDNMLEGYVLQKLDERWQVYEEIALPANVLAYTDANAKTDRQVMRYRVKGIVSTSEAITTFSNVAEAAQRFRLFFPTAFTPNDNNLNEAFKPAFLFVKKFKMTVYNRQGEIVFQTDNIENGWNGTHKGAPAPADTYAYFAEAEDQTGEKFSTKGSFILIR